MKLNQLYLPTTLVISCLAMPVQAASIFIDDFFTAQQVVVDGTPPQSSGNVVNATTALGGERDLYVEKTQGGDGERVRTRINPSGTNLMRQVIDDANGRTVVTWDGVDGAADPNQVAYNGLGGLDFNVWETLDLEVSFSDIGGPVNFTFWDGDDLTGATFAQTTFTVPGAIPGGSDIILSRNFNTDFTATGDTLVNILASVGAIQMEIDARNVPQEGWDSRFDFVQVSNSNIIPLPSTLLLLGLPLLALASRHQQRRHS